MFSRLIYQRLAFALMSKEEAVDVGFSGYSRQYDINATKLQPPVRHQRDQAAAASTTSTRPSCSRTFCRCY
jgi:hypothetical protein